VAFSATARNVYLEKADGPNGFWTRLADLERPAMFVWGDEDPLVPMAFSRHVAEMLPDARQVVLEECGHVPQVELPEDANALIHHFIDEAPATAGERASAHLNRAMRRIRQTPVNGNGHPVAEPQQG
jgi:hypothetical protein